MGGRGADVAEINGVADVIQFVERNSTEWNPPERADVVLCETLGYAVLDEGLRSTLVDARTRMLKPGGRLVPSRVDILAAPTSATDRMIDPDYIETAEGLDLGPLADMYRRLYQRVLIPRESEIAPPQVLFSLDCYTMSAREPLRTEVHFDLDADRPPRGIVLWFSATLADGVSLDSRGPSLSNHWGQTLLPMRLPSSLSGPCRLDLRLEIDDGQRFAIRWNAGLQPVLEPVQ
jgi:hypothetical protein